MLNISLPTLQRQCLALRLFENISYTALDKWVPHKWDKGKKGKQTLQSIQNHSCENHIKCHLASWIVWNIKQRQPSNTHVLVSLRPALLITPSTVQESPRSWSRAATLARATLNTSKAVHDCRLSIRCFLHSGNQLVAEVSSAFLRLFAMTMSIFLLS